MEVLIALIVVAIVIFAIVGFVMTLTKLFETPREDFPVRWCAPCQGMRAFASGRCIVCGCANAESFRCQVEHCLLGASDARQLGATQRLEAAQVAMLERFYLDGLNVALRQSGTNQSSVAVLARFSQRMAVSTPPAAAQFVAAETPRVLPQVAYAKQPAAAVSAPRGQRAPLELAVAYSGEADVLPAAVAAPRAIAPAPVVSTEAGVAPASRAALEPRQSPAEPEVPMAERLTRLLLGMGVSGLAIAALVILTAHDGSFSLWKMLGFAGATLGIFGGGVAFSRWLKLERTAGAFYTLAALFLPLNALAAHAFGVWRIDDPVGHWGLVGLGCACVYAACAGGLRSRVFVLLAGVAFIAGAGFSLEALAARDALTPWLRDALFAALPLAFGGACAAVMREKFGRWALAIPGGESLLALLGGRVVGEEGRETATVKPLENWQLLGMPLRLCADGAAIVSGLWLVINVALHGKPALIGFGLGAFELAAFVTLLALGRGWPRLIYATAAILVSSALAWVVYFGRGEHSLAPVLLGIAGLLYAGELGFARLKRAEFGLPLFHAALALGLAGLVLVGAELPRLEIWRTFNSLPPLAHSVGSLAIGGAMGAALFGWWARRERFEWASVPAFAVLATLGIILASSAQWPVHSVLTVLVATGVPAQAYAWLARRRERLSEWLGWQTFGYGVVAACIHVGLHAAVVASPSQLAWMSASAACGVALTLAVARERKLPGIAAFAGFVVPVATVAALRVLDANVELAPHALFLLFVIAGAALTLPDLLGAKLKSRELALAARSTAIGGAVLVALGAALALGAMMLKQFNPPNAGALNLALLGAGCFAMWQALRWKQPWLLIAADVALVPLTASLALQAGGDWRVLGLVCATIAAVHGAILLAPMEREWRAMLLGLGATLAGAGAVLSLGQVALESNLVPIAALALSAAFFSLASVRKPHLALSMAATACASLAAYATLTLGAHFNGLESAVALGFAAALAGCWVLYAWGEEHSERLNHWSWSLRTLGEVTCFVGGMVALGDVMAARFVPAQLVSPAFALLVGALGLAVGTALAIARGEESWRATQGFFAMTFAALGAALGLRALGVEPQWLGLCLVPAGFGALCGGMALARRKEPWHGQALALAGLLVKGAAAIHALGVSTGTDVSRGLTLGAISASLFGARWMFDERRFSYGGAATLAASAAYWLHFAGLNYAGIVAGEAMLALGLVGAGLWREREIAYSVLAQSGLALSAIVAVLLGARGPDCLGETSIIGSMIASFTLAAVYLIAARRARIAFLDFPAALALAFGALCAMTRLEFGPTGMFLGEGVLAAALVAAGLWRTRNLAESPLAISGLGLSALVTLGLPLLGGRFLEAPAVAGTLATCLVLAGLHAGIVARTRVTEFTGLALLYVSAAWCVLMHWAGFTAPEIYLLGPALCLASVGAFESKVRDVLWPREFTPNLKMALGMTLFFAPLMAQTLDLKHGWEVAMVFVSAAMVCVAGVALKLRVPLRGGIAAALFALVISLVMVIPFSRMGFGWWIGIASTLLILTGIALEKRINGWLRSNVQQARLRFAAVFDGWK